MQRCPVCGARLSVDVSCSRCGVDLKRVLRCERLAEQWLTVSLQSLRAGRSDVAVQSILRSLSFKQTPTAKLVKGFLIQQQYQALYESVGHQCWQEAGEIVRRLERLQGKNEVLLRFDEMIGYLGYGDKSLPENRWGDFNRLGQYPQSTSQ